MVGVVVDCIVRGLGSSKVGVRVRVPKGNILDGATSCKGDG